MVDRIGDLEAAPEASLAIQAVAGSDGRCRYVVELPGIRDFAASGTPQDLAGAVSAMAFTVTGYTRCVRQALDAVAVPLGAEVLLVGHSQGGIVAMDLAGDPAFNGGRVRVTHVVAAGAPISSKDVAERSGTRVFSVENVNDVVTHLDAVDSVAGRPAPARLVYQFARNEHHTVASHSARLYARQLAALSDSPNPRWRDFHESVRPYLAGTTTTTVFTLRDRPAS
jgi:pimeloyl-ACP methyl ester carboxylesterase